MTVSWEEPEASSAEEVEEAVAELRDLLEEALEEAGERELRRGIADVLVQLEDLLKLLKRYAERAERGLYELSLLDEAERRVKLLLSDLLDLEWRSEGRLNGILREACEQAGNLVDLVGMLREWAEDAIADAAPAEDDREEEEEWEDYFDDEEIDEEEEDLL